MTSASVSLKSEPAPDELPIQLRDVLNRLEDHDVLSFCLANELLQQRLFGLFRRIAEILINLFFVGLAIDAARRIGRGGLGFDDLRSDEQEKFRPFDRVASSPNQMTKNGNLFLPSVESAHFWHWSRAAD